MRFSRKQWFWGLVSLSSVSVLATGCGSSHATVAAPPHHAHQRQHHHVRPVRRKPRAQKQPSTGATPSPRFPTIATADSAPGSASSSLLTVAAREHVPAPSEPVVVVAKPGSKTRHWAFATVASVQPNVNGGYILWFGRQTSATTWQWIPSDLPGQLSSKLPPALQHTLQWAYELHLDDTYNGSLTGTPWNNVTGQVGYPEGWTVYAGYGQLDLTVWMPMEGHTHEFVGLQTQWWPSTINQGTSGLLGITEQSHTTMTQLATQKVT